MGATSKPPPLSINFTGVKFFTWVCCGSRGEVCCRSRSSYESKNGFVKKLIQNLLFVGSRDRSSKLFRNVCVRFRGQTNSEQTGSIIALSRRICERGLTRHLAVANRSRSASHKSPSGRIPISVFYLSSLLMTVNYWLPQLQVASPMSVADLSDVYLLFTIGVPVAAYS